MDRDAGSRCSRIRSSITNFFDLNYSIKKKESVENAEMGTNELGYYDNTDSYLR